MAGQRKNVHSKRLMENITLLRTLKEIIELPRENPLHVDEDNWRQLPIEHEKTVADLLAFLSATHDDNCKIMAVCLEESLDHNQLTIQISSNTGDCLYVKNGFDEIAQILEKAHSRGTMRSHHDPLHSLR
jgi:hypothetical protein